MGVTAHRSQDQHHLARRQVRVLGISLLAVALLGFLAGELIKAADVGELGVVRDLARERTPTLTEAAHALSWLGRSYVLAVAALAVSTLFWRRGRRAQAASLATSVAGAEAIWFLDKLLVQRTRPPVAHLETVTSSSFPSGHATQAAAFYLALLIAIAPEVRSKAVLWLLVLATVLLVAAVSLSRVYLGVHYPGDVIAGALLGGGWSLLVARVLLGPWPRRLRPARSSLGRR
jgi:undecaprenyl-diphosphatase